MTEQTEEFTASNPRHPEITVQLTGQDGNAMMILGLVQRGMRRAGLTAEEMDEWRNEATSGDYDHLLQTCMRWVNVT